MTRSRVFLILLFSFISGVFSASFFKMPVPIVGLFFLGGIFSVSFFWKNKKLVLAGLAILVFGLAVLRAQSFFERSAAVLPVRVNDREKNIIRGHVAEEPEKNDSLQKIIIDAGSEKSGNGWQAFPGKILVTARRFPEFGYGDELEISGVLQLPQNFEDFDYVSYLAKDGIYFLMRYPEIQKIGGGGSIFYRSLFDARARFQKTLGLILPEPQSSLLAGLILGARSTLLPELTENFKITGTTHIVALSGFNITIVSSFIIGLLGLCLIKRNAAFWISVAGIVLFSLMTGASASVVRAAIMGILILWAQRESRLYSITNAVVFAGAVMLFLNPKILRYDIGFQLSFAATLGLIYLSPFFQRWLAAEEGLPSKFNSGQSGWKDSAMVKKIKETACLTLSAQIATLPLLLYYFGRLSLVALPANLAVLSFIPLTMFFGFFAGALGFVSVFAGKIAALIAYIFLSYEIAAVGFFAKIPFSSVDFGQFPAAGVAAAYGLIAFLAVRHKLKSAGSPGV